MYSPPGPPGPPGYLNPLKAMAVMMGSPAFPHIRGTVRFAQTAGGVVVKADITGLPITPRGFFGFHLHAGRCGGPPHPPVPPMPPYAPGMPAQPPPGLPNPEENYFPEADGHYNPTNQPHPRHAGDFPALLETARGNAQLTFLTDRFTVMQAVGHAVIIHLNPDDFTTQPSGNSGPMIACGMVMPEYGPY